MGQADAMLSCVLCYYNERDYLADTIASLAAQSDRRFELVLVDNGSTDGSEQLARETARAMPDIAVSFLREDTPGKIFALARGTRAGAAPYIATLDADTIYPPEYIANVLKHFTSSAGASAVMAFGLSPASGRARPSARLRLFARFLPRKCHTGGYGQAFSRVALERVGGFDPVRWPHVLEDHEIVHRVQMHGPLVYDARHVCFPSDRRSDRSGCSWTLGERIVYKLMPNFAMGWFFYTLLASRFEKRGLNNVRLRAKTWNNAG